MPSKIESNDGIPVEMRKVTCTFSEVARNYVEDVTADFIQGRHGIDWRMVAPSSVLRDLIYFLFDEGHQVSWAEAVVLDVQASGICHSGEISAPMSGPDGKIVAIIPNRLYLQLEPLVNLAGNFQEVRGLALGPKTKLSVSSMVSDAFEALFNPRHTPSIGVPVLELLSQKVQMMVDRDTATYNATSAHFGGTPVEKLRGKRRSSAKEDR